MPEIQEDEISVSEGKNGEIFVFCNCGLVHKLTKDENDNIIVQTKFKKKESTKDNGQKKETVRKSFFNRG